MNQPHNPSMKKQLSMLAIGAAALGMGITMPSCPGQQAMQEQIDTMAKKQAEDSKKVAAMDVAVKNIQNDVKTIQGALGAAAQMGTEMKAMTDKLTAIEGDIKALKEAPKAAPAPAKGGKKKGR